MIRPPESPQPHAAPRTERGRTRAVPPPFAELPPAGVDPALDGGSRRWRSALNLLAVFVVGIGAGGAATWWMNDGSEQATLPVAPPVESARPAAQPDASATPAAAPRLPSDELPYDGVAVEGDGVFVPRIPYRIEAAPDPVVINNGANGKSDTRADADPKEHRRNNNPKAEQAPAQARNSESKKAGATEAAEKRRSGRAAGSKAATNSQKPAEKTPADRVALPKRERSVAMRPAPTAGEVERIRQQATDELWRKRVREKSPGQSSPDLSLQNLKQDL